MPDLSYKPAIVGVSLERLNTCKPDLRAVVHEANKILEVSVLCGRRDKIEQDEAYASGHSKLQWPDSKHNVLEPDGLSSAVDLIPYFVSGQSHYDWDDSLAFARLAGVMFAVADSLDIKIRWGGDFDGDGRSKDEKFLDLVHFELASN